MISLVVLAQLNITGSLIRDQSQNRLLLEEGG